MSPPVREPVAGPIRRLQTEERPALTVADLAFEYSRAVLAMWEVGEETKTRALTWLAESIVPLAGTLPADKLTPKLRRNVGRILADEANEDGRLVASVWMDFTRWSASYLAHERRRGFAR